MIVIRLVTSLKYKALRPLVFISGDCYLCLDLVSPKSLGDQDLTFYCLMSIMKSYSVYTVILTQKTETETGIYIKWSP